MNYIQQPMLNPKDISDLTTAMNMALIAQPGMNMGQDRQIQMNAGNQVVQDAVQKLDIQNVGNQNGLILLIAQKEETGIQLQVEEFDLMAAVGVIDEIEKVNANCILMANLQQASTSGTQTDKAPIYDSNGSAEVHHYENCYDNEIFNMFTQKEYVEHNGGTVEQHPATVEETRAYLSLYNNLAIEVKKVNKVNRKMKETNADLTTELA
ncbi:hypothetical protein Tco_0942975 [Tanacetum coccineum]